MRAGGDRRGSNHDRHVRKLWLLATFDGCVWCGCDLDYDTVEADRKVPGGSYRRDNIQASCKPCNQGRSNRTDLTVAQIINRGASIRARMVSV